MNDLPRRPRRPFLGGLIIACCLLLSPTLLVGATERGTVAAAVCTGTGSPFGLGQCIGATASERAFKGATPERLTPVGALALPGYNADVWAHGQYAYVGTWGTSSAYPTRCPATGVRIIDLADPANPTLVGAVATIAGTSQEDVVVKRIETVNYLGDLLVTGIQACGANTAQRGIDLWDVTNPRQPQHLAFWESGPAAPSSARGVHELYLFQRGDRAYVAAAVPSSEALEGVGDFQLVDVTDPRKPVRVGSWGTRLDGGIAPTAGQSHFAHSAWANEAGTMAIVSYWDAGVILLDISDPTNPTMIGRTPYPARSAGDSHSIWLAHDETIMLVADETLDTSLGSWGFLRIFDIRNPAQPVQIGQYATPNSATTRRDGTYTIHNPFVVGDRAFLSWYTDGIRVLDIGNPAAPREVAAYVPPAAIDPYRSFTDTAQVWGVYVQGNLVLASDINAGLFVLRYER